MIVVIKIGGSCLTYKKEKVARVRTTFLQNFSQQLKLVQRDEKNINIILVHGGGSVTHSLVDKYQMSEFLKNKGIYNKKQKEYSAKIHLTMNKLNNEISEFFLKNNINVWPVQTSAVAFVDHENHSNLYVESIKVLLKHNFIPLLHGDLVQNIERGISIFSGDLATCLIANKLNADKVIFLSDVDGVFDWFENDKNHGRCLSTLNVYDKRIIKDCNNDHSGGMRDKIKYIKKYCNETNNVLITNGLLNDSWANYIFDEYTPGTKIVFK